MKLIFHYENELNALKEDIGFEFNEIDNIFLDTKTIDLTFAKPEENIFRLVSNDLLKYDLKTILPKQCNISDIKTVDLIVEGTVVSTMKLFNLQYTFSTSANAETNAIAESIRSNFELVL